MHPFSGGGGWRSGYVYVLYVPFAFPSKVPLSTEEEEACVWDVYFWGVRLFWERVDIYTHTYMLLFCSSFSCEITYQFFLHGICSIAVPVVMFFLRIV